MQGRAAPAEESDADACEIQPQPPALIPTWAVCINCDKEFNEGIPRVIGECRYHPGGYFQSKKLP